MCVPPRGRRCGPRRRCAGRVGLPQRAARRYTFACCFPRARFSWRPRASALCSSSCRRSSAFRRIVCDSSHIRRPTRLAASACFVLLCSSRLPIHVHPWLSRALRSRIARICQRGDRARSPSCTELASPSTGVVPRRSYLLACRRLCHHTLSALSPPLAGDALAIT